LSSKSSAEFTFVQTKNVALDTPSIRGINFKPDGAPARIRTADLLITNLVSLIK